MVMGEKERLCPYLAALMDAHRLFSAPLSPTVLHATPAPQTVALIPEHNFGAECEPKDRLLPRQKQTHPKLPKMCQSCQRVVNETTFIKKLVLMTAEGIRNNDRKEHLLLRDAPDIHYLEDIWNFYYLVPDKRGAAYKEWSSFIKKLTSIASIEDIYATLQAVYEPKKLPKGCRYYIFKMIRKNVASDEQEGKEKKELQEIRPLWECEANLGGQELFHEFPVVDDRPPDKRGGNRGQQNGRRGETQKMNNELAEQRWRDLILHVMCRVKAPTRGTTIPWLDNINGLEFNCRGSVVKVGLWVSKNAKPEQIEEIKAAMSKILDGEIKENLIMTEQAKQAAMQGK